MTQLVTPDPRWHASWAESMLEFGDEYPHGSGVGDPGAGVDERGAQRSSTYLLALREEAPRPDWVRCTFFWIAEGDEVIGSIALRHELTPGCSMRAATSATRSGRRAAARATPPGRWRWRSRARRLDLERVLLTCDLDNHASRRTIERNGGVLEDVRAGKRRYWIALG